MIALPTKSDACTGCGACRAVCPVNAISMVEDDEGLSRPQISKRNCIQCGKCLKVCSAFELKPTSAGFQQNIAAYAVQAKSRELLQNSSSGGVFGLLAKYVLHQGGAVCGCAWNEDFKSVGHRLIETVEALPPLLESKYLQSDVPPEVYQHIVTLIKSKRYVLFCGTPCQVCGLEHVIDHSKISKIEKDTFLLKVALICHGVPSPGVWRRFVIEEEERHGNQKVIAARFRDKRTTWQRFAQVLKFQDGTESVGNVIHRNEFMHYFWGKENITLRRSCSSCRCKLTYQSDLTLGDFWGIEKVFPEIAANEGISAVIVHSKAGSNAIDKIKNELQCFQKANVDDIEKYNYLWHESLPMSPKRKRFYKLFNRNKLTLGEIAIKLSQMSLKDRLYHRFAKIKSLLKRLIKKSLFISR